LHLIMDRAYEDNETLQLALDFGFIPVVPPRPQRLEPWLYDKAMYRRRNEIERLFRRLKGFRRIFSRFDKLDLVFLGFLHFALIVEALRYLISVNTPYTESMFLRANAVKLRRCQCALLFCSPSHNGNQGFVRVERRVRGPQRAPKLRLLGWLSAAEEIGLGSILKGRTFRACPEPAEGCAVELLIFVILSEDAFAIANASESKSLPRAKPRGPL
jgi:transposase